MNIYHLLIHLLLLKLVSGDLPPTFNFQPSPLMIQEIGKVWHAGVVDRIGALLDYPGVGINVSVSGKCSNPQYELWAKCPGETSETRKCELHKFGNNDKCPVCDQSVSPFIVYKTENNYEMKLTEISNTATTNQFPFVDVRVKAICGEQTLESNRLSLFNLEFIKNQQSVGKLISEDAINKIQSIGTLTNDFETVDYLSAKAKLIFSDLSLILRNHLQISIAFTTAASCGAKDAKYAYIGIVDFVFGRDDFDAKIAQAYYIDYDNNKLHFAPYAVAQLITQFAGKPICVFASTNKDDGDISIDNSEIISNTIMSSTVNTTSAPASPQCKQVGSPSLNLISNTGNVYYTCPIICTHDTAQSFKFTRNGRVILPKSGTTWHKDIDNDVEIHHSGKVLKFPSKITDKHAGQYECEAGNVKYSVNAKVYIFPEFDDSLPPVIYAMRGESYSVSCQISHKNVGSVDLQPAFIVNSGSKNIKQFNDMKHYSVTYKVLDSAGTKQLTIIMNKIAGSGSLKPDKDLSHIFACNASASGKAVFEVMGTTDKVFTQRRSKVYHVRRPTIDDFHLIASCSNSSQYCSPQIDSTFEVIMNKQYSSYLAQIGVSITHDVLLKSKNLSETSAKDVLKEDIISVEFLNNNLKTSIKIVIHPFSDPASMKFLDEAVLIPVFYLKYNSKMGSLQLDKTKYRSVNYNKCQSDKQCFYSTLNDKDSQLFDLKFYMPFDKTAASKNQMKIIIMVILLVVLLLLLIAGISLYYNKCPAICDDLLYVKDIIDVPTDGQEVVGKLSEDVVRVKEIIPVSDDGGHDENYYYYYYYDSMSSSNNDTADNFYSKDHAQDEGKMKRYY